MALLVSFFNSIPVNMEVRQMVQDDDYAYPYFDIPEGSWWSFNTKPMAGNTLDFTDVDENWSLRFNLQTNVPYSPINVIFFNGNKQFYYELTEETFPDRSGAEFIAMSIPLKDFILEDDAMLPFPGTYTEGQQFFTLHANEGEGSGLFVAIDDVYLTNEESDPDGPNPPVDPDDPEYDAAYCSPCNPEGPNFDPDAEECNPDGIFAAGTDDTNIRYQNGSLLVENTTGISTVTVTDLQGRIILTDEVNGKNTFYKELNLVQGIYIVDVTHVDLTKKVIKIIL